jgi:hypothetical protein
MVGRPGIFVDQRARGLFVMPAGFLPDNLREQQNAQI